MSKIKGHYRHKRFVKWLQTPNPTKHFEGVEEDRRKRIEDSIEKWWDRGLSIAAIVISIVALFKS